jgi:hypothetical protein
MATVIETETRVCTRCATVKPLDEYYPDHRRTDGLMSHCKPCDLTRQKQWRQQDPERYRAGVRIRRRRNAYGLTTEDYLTMLKAQQGVCAICQATQSDHGMTDDFLVDHDHRTGKVRGLLCVRCNSGLGHFRDNPELMLAAIAYLEAH